MGSLLEITLYGTDSNRCAQALKSAFNEAQRLEHLLSPFMPDSELSRVNSQASSGPIKVDPELFSLIQRGIDLGQMSHGALDFTVGPLMKLWGFRIRCDLISTPTPDQIQKVSDHVGFQKVLIDRCHLTVEYQMPGLEIEFGAMGKGYTVDQIAGVIMSRQISSALIHFGSSTYALGSPPGKEGWWVAIRHPRNRETAINVVTLKDCAISTSGDYEQSVYLNGRRLSHILDPRNGYPVSEVISVSVISPSALESDAFSTAAFVMGPKDGLEFLEKRSDVEALLASEESDRKLQWFQTSGWTNFDLKQPCFSPARRKFLAGLLAIAGYLMLGPRMGYAMIYLTREEALQKLIPQADDFKEEVITLTPSQREEVQRLLGKRIGDSSFTFWVAQKSGTPVGYAVLLDVIGKEQPITFMVGVNPAGTVLGVEVLIYRESQGSEIRSIGFMNQFVSKTLNAPLKLGRDIHSISGATLSSRSTAYAVKKALALIEVVYLRSGPRAP